MKLNVIIIFFSTFLLSNSIEINSTSYDDWVYINFAVGGEIDASAADTPGWDIACQRYHFRTNSGLSGNGLGGAYVDSVSTWTSELYASLIEVPENSFFEKDTVVNTFYDVIDTDGDGVEEHIFGLPGIANPSLETWGWIDINNNYVMNYTDHQFIVRSGLGDKFYKLWAINYYNDNGTSGYIKIYFDEISPCGIVDECGECNGDNSSCTGCTDEIACNYDVMAVINDGCEYPLEDYDCDGLCIGDDNDGDDICNDDDDCPDTYNPYQHDYDGDGTADACDDNDDDNDGLDDCWNYWYGDGNTMTEDERLEMIANGECDDFELGMNDIVIHEEFRLSQNYPNPFNPSTTIKYSVKTPSKILIDIFDIRGKNVVVLENTFKNTGIHTLNWNGLNDKKQKMPSGIYIYRLMSNGVEIDQKKMLLLY